jgi:hypothetical protein
LCTSEWPDSDRAAVHLLMLAGRRQSCPVSWELGNLIGLAAASMQLVPFCKG